MRYLLIVAGLLGGLFGVWVIAYGRANASPLARRVWMHCGDERESLQDWCGRAGQFEFAQLARAVCECEESDPVASRLLAQATSAGACHADTIAVKGVGIIRCWRLQSRHPAEDR